MAEAAAAPAATPETADVEMTSVTGDVLPAPVPEVKVKQEKTTPDDDKKDDDKMKAEGVKGEGVKGEGVKGESVKGEPSVKQEKTKGESVKGEGAKTEGTKGEQVKGEGAKSEAKKELAVVKGEVKKERSGSRKKKDKKVKRELGEDGKKEKKKKDKKDKKRARSGSQGGRKRKSKWGPDVPAGFSGQSTTSKSGMAAITGGHEGENVPRFSEEEMLKRVVVLENLPSHISGQELVEFFNGAVLAVTANAVQQSANKMAAPVFACVLLEEDRGGGDRRKVAEMKFRTPDGASVGMKLNGIEYKGSKLKCNRPDSFDMADGDPATKINLHEMSMTKLVGANGGKDGPGSGISPKLSIFNLPETMSEQVVRDLLSQFGKLRMMSLIRDLATGKIKGYGIFEYDDPNEVDLAILALNGFVCGQNVVRVQKLGGQQQQGNAPKAQPVAATAMSNSMTQKIVSNPVLAMQVKQGREIGSRPSPIVQLLNAVYQEDLMDDQDYDDIMAEIHNMASKHGTVSRVIIPKPSKDGTQIDGVGKVFVVYSDVTAARKFQLDVNGRKFEHRVVCASFYPQDKFLEGKYKLWAL